LEALKGRDFGSNRCPIIVFMDKSARIQSNPKGFLHSILFYR